MPNINPKLKGGEPEKGAPRDYTPDYVRGKSYSCTLVWDPETEVFADGTECSFGDEVEVTEVEVDYDDKRILRMKVEVATEATTGEGIGSITVTRPDKTTIVLEKCFSIK